MGLKGDARLRWIVDNSEERRQRRRYKLAEAYEVSGERSDASSA